MKSKLTQIYFFGADGTVQNTHVLHSDLPRLAGGQTFWRESMSDEERGKLLKVKLSAILNPEDLKD